MPTPLTRATLVLATLSFSPPLLAQGADAPAPAAADVQKAIDAGAGWLRERFKAGFPDDSWHDSAELAVLTLAHAGANLKDPIFAKGLEALEKAEPRFTYRTALLAMALAEVNPRKYQARIAHCAQWLVDTQLAEGEWGYPGAPAGVGRRPEGYRVSPPPEAAPKEPGKDAAKEAAIGRIVIQKRESITASGPMKGDFSNAQFAILGLRACRDAGVDAPAATWKAAYAYLKKYQRPDGGWGYVMTGEQDEASYASLTAAGVCSAAICLHATGAKDVKNDPVVRRGLGWLSSNPDVEHNTGIDKSSIVVPTPWQYYHLYSVERAGRVLGLEQVGGTSWYSEGARWLLGQQKPDGHWEDENLRGDVERPSYLTIADTCFAILFLTRATRPLTGR